MLNKTPLSQLNEMIREDLITEGIITGRESKCGVWSNPEKFPRQPYQVKWFLYGTYFRGEIMSPFREVVLL